MNARLRYVTDSVETASPARLLVQLYDRLVLDLTRGEQALAAGDRAAASEQICHAQDIITELHATLKVDAWSGGRGAVADLHVRPGRAHPGQHRPATPPVSARVRS